MWISTYLRYVCYVKGIFRSGLFEGDMTYICVGAVIQQVSFLVGRNRQILSKFTWPATNALCPLWWCRVTKYSSQASWKSCGKYPTLKYKLQPFSKRIPEHNSFKNYTHLQLNTYIEDIRAVHIQEGKLLIFLSKIAYVESHKFRLEKFYSLP